MPTWLKCEDCGCRYYTSADQEDLETPGRCESCGGKLKIVEHSNPEVSAHKQPGNNYNS